MTTSQPPSIEAPPVHLDPPTFKDGDAMLIAGLQGHFNRDTAGQILVQWLRFIPHLGNVPGQIGRTLCGAHVSSPNGFDYLSGVQVANSTGLPADLKSYPSPHSDTQSSRIRRCLQTRRNLRRHRVPVAPRSHSLSS